MSRLAYVAPEVPEISLDLALRGEQRIENMRSKLLPIRMLDLESA